MRRSLNRKLGLSKETLHTVTGGTQSKTYHCTFTATLLTQGLSCGCPRVTHDWLSCDNTYCDPCDTFGGRTA
jgi:hypothetical protein